MNHAANNIAGEQYARTGDINALRGHGEQITWAPDFAASQRPPPVR